MVLIAVSLTILAQGQVQAEPSSSQVRTQQQQLEQNKNALKDVEDKREELEASIERLDNQIENYMSQIEENKVQITQSEKDIIKAKEEVKEKEEDLKKQQQVFDKRARAMYMSGQTSYLKVILQAQSFSDLISRVEMVKKVISFDKKTISDLEKVKLEVENKKTSLEEELNRLTALNNENESKLVSLNNDMTTQKKLIEEVKSDEKIFANKVNESQALVNATLAQVNSIRAAAPVYQPSRGAATVSDNNIIAYASNFLGTPYLWGGTSPVSGFDCSGFTQYVYAHFGVKLGRTTYDQINDGYQVSRSELQAGDLVFFGTWSDPGHMGIYIGNNTYIHAPRTGDVVKISPMTRPDYVTARRVK
jgi:peptidoglycan hydrolase CwlO-like protein